MRAFGKFWREEMHARALVSPYNSDHVRGPRMESALSVPFKANENVNCHYVQFPDAIIHITSFNMTLINYLLHIQKMYYN